MNAMRGFLKWCQELNANESGNVMVLVALSMVVFCGFAALVIDVGGLYLQHQRAQAAADAGALAGADTLVPVTPTSAAVAASVASAANTALHMAQSNDAVPAFTARADANSETVTVTGKQTVPLTFARILGFPSAKVQVSSKAELGTLSQAVGVVPIAVPNQNFQYGQQVCLSQSAGNGSSGNYGYLDFSGKGSNGLEYDIEHGYDFPLSVGEQVDTKTGMNTGPVENAITYRMSEVETEGCDSFETATGSCSRVMVLPVVNTLDVSGKKPVTILGFATFYLDGMVNSGGQQQIEGRFIQMVRAGALGSGENYGTYGVKLTAP